MLFQDMCHGCGGCFAVCPSDALTVSQRKLGHVEQGTLPDGSPFIAAETRVGEVMTPPVLRRLLETITALEKKCAPDVLIDAPPGVSCPAVTIANHVDVMVLVVDPTPFGFADFKLAFTAFKDMDLRLACVINRTGLPGNSQGDALVENFCQSNAIPVVGTIPFAKEAAKCLAEGTPLALLNSTWKEQFQSISQNLLTVLTRGTHGAEH